MDARRTAQKSAARRWQNCLAAQENAPWANLRTDGFTPQLN
jgi:hypothetical protein